MVHCEQEDPAVIGQLEQRCPHRRGFGQIERLDRILLGDLLGSKIGIRLATKIDLADAQLGYGTDLLARFTINDDECGSQLLMTLGQREQRAPQSVYIDPAAIHDGLGRVE